MGAGSLGPTSSRVNRGGEGGSPVEDDRGTPDEEPQLSGTLFIVMVIIILTAGMWAAVYFTLLER